MPAEGLPSTLKGKLSALIKEHTLSSFKIDGRGDNLVVLLRFSTCRPVNRRHGDTGSRLRHNWQGTRDELTADKVSDHSFPTPFFLPTPPGHLTATHSEMNATTSHFPGLGQRGNACHDHTARESRFATTNETCGSECVLRNTDLPSCIKSVWANANEERSYIGT